MIGFNLETSIYEIDLNRKRYKSDIIYNGGNRDERIAHIKRNSDGHIRYMMNHISKSTEKEFCAFLCAMNDLVAKFFQIWKLFLK